jgi:GNAT superfamily N-acetyltransferase
MTMLTMTRIDESFARWEELLSLIMQSFAYMDGVIDPPSSAHRLTAQSLQDKAKAEIGFVVMDEDILVGCMFLKPEDKTLYLGKLAISADHQGKGIGRQLLAKAEETAKALSLPAIRLETRIELTGNHATFGRWGFIKTAENRHAGYDRSTSIEMQKMLG